MNVYILNVYRHTIFDPRNRNRYITHLQYTVLSPEDRAGVLIYPTMFYVSLSAEKLPARRHQTVASWTKGVNIFSKDLLVFPICTKNHWILILVSKPGLVTTSDKTNINNKPLLISVESLGLGPKALEEEEETIRQYLSEEWRTRMSPYCGGKTFQFSATQMRTMRPKKVRISNV